MRILQKMSRGKIFCVFFGSGVCLNKINWLLSSFVAHAWVFAFLKNGKRHENIKVVYLRMISK